MSGRGEGSRLSRGKAKRFLFLSNDDPTATFLKSRSGGAVKGRPEGATSESELALDSAGAEATISFAVGEEKKSLCQKAESTDKEEKKYIETERFS